jgi:hypothetical protein
VREIVDMRAEAWKIIDTKAKVRKRRDEMRGVLSASCRRRQERERAGRKRVRCVEIRIRRETKIRGRTSQRHVFWKQRLCLDDGEDGV